MGGAGKGPFPFPPPFECWNAREPHDWPQSEGVRLDGCYGNQTDEVKRALSSAREGQRTWCLALCTPRQSNERAEGLADAMVNVKP